jgi:hypothetical protein
MLSYVKSVVLESGKVVEFRRFSSDDIDNLSDLYKAELKAVSVKTGAEDKLNKAEMLQLKLSLDAQVVDYTQLYNAARSTKWSNIFLKRSLTLAGVAESEQDAIIGQMTMLDRVDCAEKLILDIAELEKHEPKKEEQPPLANSSGLPTSK